MGTLAATGHAQDATGFTYSSTEHGYILVLASARADLTYQQGLRKLWSRSTRYDFYFPVFAMLGNRPSSTRKYILTDQQTMQRYSDIRKGGPSTDTTPSQITGIFRSTSAGTIDYWHSAQKFTALPTLNATFIKTTQQPLHRETSQAVH